MNKRCAVQQGLEGQEFLLILPTFDQFIDFRDNTRAFVTKEVKSYLNGSRNRNNSPSSVLTRPELPHIY